jgi:Ni,Fe-hydrogenase III large subunit
MTSSALQLCVATKDIPAFEISSFRADVLRRRALGARLVTLYGRRLGESVELTAIHRDPSGQLAATRSSALAARGYEAITKDLPAAHCFEREVHEQTGIPLEGHPWLKPIRYEGQTQSAMSSYPYYKVEGKEVHEVAVGPIHAGVIEPGSFRFMCHGEQVLHLEIHLGYQHRGVEAELLKRDPTCLAPLVETIAGDSSIEHAWAYAAALEALAGVSTSLDWDVARAALLELERVAMHLACLSGLAADIGFLQGATTYGRLRTTAINTSMRLCGSRFGKGGVVPNGSGARLDPPLLAVLKSNLSLLRADVAIINDCFLDAKTVQHRLYATGTLTQERALELGLVGVSARSCGVPLDARDKASAGTYAAVPIPMRVEPGGDCMARARVRISEIDASLAFLTQIVEKFPAWQRVRAPIGALAKEHLSVAVVEGVRGEVVHCLETNDSGALAHYKVQDPSLRNWMGLAIAVRGNEISDFPICNKSFDLSYCGNDL